MELIKTRFKNILTFGGDKIHTIHYLKGNISQIAGENGLGKSNIVKMLDIGAYYKYPNTVATVINDTCKEGFIEHTIRSNGSIWQIHNLFKSNKLFSVTVKKDGIVQDWGNPSKAQTLVSENIVDIPYSVFSNIFCSSIDNVSSILKLSAKDSRDITNNIFDLNDINIINKDFLSKDDNLNNKNIEIVNQKLDTTRKYISNSIKNFREYKEKEEKRLDVKKEEIEESIKSIKSGIESNDNDYRL